MSLPSYDSAMRYLRGEPGAGADVLVSILGRALIIGAGGLVAARATAPATPIGTLAAFAIGGALAVEVFVLLHASRAIAREQLQPEPAPVVDSPVTVDFGV